MKDIRLEAIMMRGEILLYDIRILNDRGEYKWIGSRRTFNGCAVFLGLKPEHLIRLAELT